MPPTFPMLFWRGRLGGCFVLVVVLLALLTPSSADGQWLEGVINLPDSLGGALWPTRIAYDSAGGRLYVSGRYGQAVVVIDLATREKVARIPVNYDRSAGGTNELCYDPTANRLYVTLRGYDTVRVVDCAVDSVVRSIWVENGARVMLSNPALNKLYCGGSDILTVVDCTADTVVATLQVGYWPEFLFLSEAGDKLYCATNYCVWVIDCRADTVLTVLPLPGAPIAGCYNPVYDKLYISDLSSAVTIIDCGADSVLAVFADLGESWALCCNPVDGTVYCAAGYDSVFAIDGETDRITAAGGTDWCPQGMACNPTMNTLYVSCADRKQGPGVGNPVIDVMDCTLLGVFDRINMPDSAPIACLPAHDLLVSFHKDLHAVSFIDTRVNQVVDTCYVASHPRVGCYNPVNNKAYFVDWHSNFSMVLDCSAGNVTRLVPSGRWSRGLYHDPVVNKAYIAETGTHQFPCSTVMVLDGVSDSVLARLHVGAWPKYMCGNPARGKVYCRVVGGLAVIDAVTNTVLGQIPLPADDIPGCIIYNPVTDRVYCTGTDRSGADWMRVIDSRTDSVVLSPWIPAAAFSALLIPRYNKLYLNNGSYPLVYDCNHDTVAGRVEAAGLIGSFCYNPKDDKVYLASRGMPAGLYIVDAATDSVLRFIEHMGGPAMVLYDSLHNLVYVSEFTADRVALVSGTSDSIVQYVDVGRSPQDMVWNSRDCRTYVICKFNSALYVIRDTTGMGVAEFPASSNPTRARRAVVNGTLELAGREQAILFDITGRKVMDLHPGPNDVHGLVPGAYYVRQASSVEHPASSVRKVILTR